MSERARSVALMRDMLLMLAATEPAVALQLFETALLALDPPLSPQKRERLLKLVREFLAEQLH